MGSSIPYMKKLLSRIVTDTRRAVEAVNLPALSSGERPDCFPIVEKGFNNIKSDMFNAYLGYYFHRREGFGLSRMNYIRWATAPALNGLANLEFARRRREKGN